MNNTLSFIWDRRSSFAFAIGSASYGFYHFFKPNVLGSSGAYEALDFILGILSGQYFGLLFVVIGAVQLYGVITNNTRIRLSSYLSLLFLWILLSIGFFIAFLNGNDNAAWIYTTLVAILSTNIIGAESTICKSDSIG